MSPNLKDLNRARFDQLLGLPGIGVTLARKIMARRPLRSVHDLMMVRGIAAGKLRRLRPLVRVKA
jgi:competence protein ComEA